MSLIVALLAPLFELLASLVPRACEDVTIDTSQLAFALKRAGYVPKFGACGALHVPRVVLMSEALTIAELRRPKRRRRKRRAA